MFSGFGLTELLVILAIVLLIFGPKRLKSLGSDLGSAIKGFRTAVTDEEAKPETTAGEEKIIEGEVSSVAVKKLLLERAAAHPAVTATMFGVIDRCTDGRWRQFVESAGFS